MVLAEQTVDGLHIPQCTFYVPSTDIIVGTYTYGSNPPVEYYFRYADGTTATAYGLFVTAADYPILREVIVASDTPNVTIIRYPSGSATTASSYTYNGQTVYFTSAWYGWGSSTYYATNIATNQFTSELLNNKQKIAWAMVYGEIIPDSYAVTYDLVNCTGSPDNPNSLPVNIAIANFDFTPDSENGVFTFDSGSCWIDGSGLEGAPVEFVWDPETGHLRIGPITSAITIHVHASGDPYQTIDGESDIPGGDTISVPSLPSLSSTSSGVVGLFAPSSAQMRQLSDYMWTDFGGTGTTTEDILKEVVQALKRSISSPLDYVVGLNIIPSQGLSVGSSTPIRFGFVTTDVSMPRLTSQYFTVNCGTISFSAICGDTFLDYAPYSKFSIYLPYIGVKEVDANDFVGHTIGVIYHGDVVTGGITAYITKDGSVMYQYSGCCALSVPLNADGWGSTIAGAVQIATSIVAGGATGGAAGAATAAAQGAASVAENPSLLSPQVMRSGAVSGGAGCMGVQTPFVIREAVRFHSTSGFNTVSGYPAYYYQQLSSVHGYTKVLDVHLHGLPATQAEIEEIEEILKEGVIL